MVIARVSASDRVNGGARRRTCWSRILRGRSRWAARTRATARSATPASCRQRPLDSATPGLVWGSSFSMPAPRLCSVASAPTAAARAGRAGCGRPLRAPRMSSAASPSPAPTVTVNAGPLGDAAGGDAPGQEFTFRWARQHPVGPWGEVITGGDPITTPPAPPQAPTHSLLRQGPSVTPERPTSPSSPSAERPAGSVGTGDDDVVGVQVDLVSARCCAWSLPRWAAVLLWWVWRPVPTGRSRRGTGVF